jgi:hypothetical protein
MQFTKKIKIVTFLVGYIAAPGEVKFCLSDEQAKSVVPVAFTNDGRACYGFKRSQDNKNLSTIYHQTDQTAVFDCELNAFLGENGIVVTLKSNDEIDPFLSIGNCFYIENDQIYVIYCNSKKKEFTAQKTDPLHDTSSYTPIQFNIPPKTLVFYNSTRSLLCKKLGETFAFFFKEVKTLIQCDIFVDAEGKTAIIKLPNRNCYYTAQASYESEQYYLRIEDIVQPQHTNYQQFARYGNSFYLTPDNKLVVKMQSIDFNDANTTNVATYFLTHNQLSSPLPFVAGDTARPIDEQHNLTPIRSTTFVAGNTARPIIDEQHNHGSTKTTSGSVFYRLYTWVRNWSVWNWITQCWCK